MSDRSPLLDHPLDAPSAFRADDLMAAVRSERGLAADPLPPLCVLDFDGDLFDDLLGHGSAVARPWPCFHTPMIVLEVEGIECAVIPRTIGGPYAVLVAEQLHAGGARLILGLTSAGRVSPALALPSVVVVNEAIRDEGTSLHYLPPSATVGSPCPEFDHRLAHELANVSTVYRGLVWTTDAPYRETDVQLRSWSQVGALAVEMQAASLFAFARARTARLGVLALVSNALDHAGGQFNTGGPTHRRAVLSAASRAAAGVLAMDRRPGRALRT